MANRYTKLFINNSPIDLNTDEQGTPIIPLNINRLVNDLEGNVRGDYSRVSITVPATKNNISILGSSRSFKDFRIEIDGLPDMLGTAQIKKIHTKSYGYESLNYAYDINLLSNNTSWTVLLRDTLLSDLTTTVINWDVATINPLGFIAEPNLRDWAFTFIKWKEWANTRGAGLNFRYTPSFEETTPLLYVRPFIERAFNLIGYTVKSNWLSSDTASKYVMPVPIPDRFPYSYNEEYLNTEVSLTVPTTFPVNAPVNDTILYDNIIKAAPQNPTAYNPLTGQYTCPLDGYYQIDISYTYPLLPFPSPPSSFISSIYQNGTNTLTGAFLFWGDLQYPAGKTIRGTALLYANAGDTFENKYLWDAAIPLGITGATMKITGEASKTFGMPLDFKFMLGDLKFLDMLKDLKILFNLAFETNEASKVVTIEPKDEYVQTNRLLGTSNLVEGFYKNECKDYTPLLDLNKNSGKEFPNIEGTYINKYQSDSSDETANWLEENSNIGVYESRFKMDSSDDSKTKIIETKFFAKTIHVSDFQAKGEGSIVNPQFPLIYPQNYVLDPTATIENTNVKPRLLYFAGQRFGTLSGVDGFIEINEFAPGVLTPVPACFAVNYLDESGLDPVLSFSSEIVNNTKFIGLLEKHYLKEYVRLNIGDISDYYVKFNSIDNLNFSFRLKGYFFSQKYIIQEINSYNPIKDTPTQFKFLLEATPTESDINKIQNSTLSGVVTLLTTI
ncbi:hypothetical protein AB832_06950 [Flavobacteriaceae bacterium (ex Bugula neritina AB1)]|nr:hypothetical protein AB832_06950 [Flavobacteriaceae bacterium (ex Bugula neritina AB1)]